MIGMRLQLPRLGHDWGDLARIFPGKVFGGGAVSVVCPPYFALAVELSLFPLPGVPARLSLPPVLLPAALLLPRIFDLTIFVGFVEGARLRVGEFLGGF